MLNPDIGAIETASSFAEVGYRYFRHSSRLAQGWSVLEYSCPYEEVSVADDGIENA